MVMQTERSARQKQLTYVLLQMSRERKLGFIGECLGMETYIIYLMCRIHQIGNINRRECSRGRFQKTKHKKRTW